MNDTAGSVSPRERLVMLQRLLGEALDRLGAGAYAVDADWALVAMNAQAEMLLGLGADEALGQDAHD
ncbi:DNA-binding protein, partial [Streptomyces roseolus]